MKEVDYTVRCNVISEVYCGFLFMQVEKGITALMQVVRLS
jgi:hypothetical protein